MGTEWAHLRSSIVSNFLGFLGQQSHIKNSCTPPGPLALDTGSLRGDCRGRLSLMPRWRRGARDIDPLGEGSSETGALSGDVQLSSVPRGDMAPGENGTGDRLPNPVLVAERLRLDMYELLLAADDTEDIDPWCSEPRRGVGDPRDGSSRRLQNSPWPGRVKGRSSPAGEEARRF